VIAVDRLPRQYPDRPMGGTEVADLVHRSMLIGGDPGCGKPVPLTLLTAPAVLSSPEDDTAHPASDPQEA